jgi:hypothetical protein
MVRWSYRNVAFAAIHYTSSNNGWLDNDTNRQKETTERVQAMKEVLAELKQSAIQRKRDAVVVATQVDPFIEKCQGHYADICESVQQLASNLPVPVLLVHGDTNGYCLDQPIADAPNLWRLNGVGDWKVIDADLVSFDPTNPRKPFTVRGLLSGLEPLSRCNYRSQEPDDNLRFNRLAALVPLATANCQAAQAGTELPTGNVRCAMPTIGGHLLHRCPSGMELEGPEPGPRFSGHPYASLQHSCATQKNHAEIQQSLPRARPSRHAGAHTSTLRWPVALGGMGVNQLSWSPVEGAADYAVRVSDARGQLRFQDTVKDTKVLLPVTIRCDEPGLSVSVSAHSERRVPGPPAYPLTGNCLVSK